jgi:bifunctional oligoribonuclease and PAP phosphatase NrnA
MQNNTPKEIWDKLKESKNLLMSLHYGPDGDSLGSCVAMKQALEENLDCKVTLIGKDPLDAMLTELDCAKEVKFGKGVDETELSEFDLILAIDIGTLKQFVGRNKGFKFPDNLPIINIDHHHNNDFYGTLNYVNSKKSSACGVLLELFKEWNIKINPELATKILLGIYTDTGYFSHDNGDAIKDAAFLIDKGADYLKGIVNKIKYNFPLRIKKYISLLYQNFKTAQINNHNIGYSTISIQQIKDLGLNLAEARSGVNDLQEVGGFDVIFTLTELEDKIKGSFRSRNSDISVIAKELGGGGHKGAAAFILPKMPLEKAEKIVLETINKVGIHEI